MWEGTMNIQEQIMRGRAQQGLRLTFIIPGRLDVFVCFPKDDASAAEWMAKAQKRGWVLADDEAASCSGH
jgi:hypothetical protein